MKKLEALGGDGPKVPNDLKPTYDPEVVDWLCKQPPVPTVEEIRKRADKLAEDTNYKEALAAQCTN